MERRPLRAAAAVLGVLLAALLAGGFWTVGQAQYLEDYCTTRVDPPRTSPPEALSGRPAYLSGPATVRCEYDGLPDVEVTDPLPLVGALVLGALVVATAVTAAARASRGAGGYSEPPSSRATVS